MAAGWESGAGGPAGPCKPPLRIMPPSWPQRSACPTLAPATLARSRPHGCRQPGQPWRRWHLTPLSHARGDCSDAERGCCPRLARWSAAATRGGLRPLSAGRGATAPRLLARPAPTTRAPARPRRSPVRKLDAVRGSASATPDATRSTIQTATPATVDQTGQALARGVDRLRGQSRPVLVDQRGRQARHRRRVDAAMDAHPLALRHLGGCQPVADASRYLFGCVNRQPLRDLLDGRPPELSRPPISGNGVPHRPVEHLAALAPNGL